MTRLFTVAGFHFTLSDVIGILGVCFVLWAYLWIQLDRLSQNDLRYSCINFTGSVLISISLLYTWNLASFIIEVAWLSISLYGITKCFLRKIKTK